MTIADKSPVQNHQLDDGLIRGATSSLFIFIVTETCVSLVPEYA